MELEFGFITADEMDTTRRGRKPNEVSLELARVLEGASKGDILRITSLTVDPADDKEKAQVGNIIRSAGRLAGRKVGINWSKAGVPQVTVKV